jgi:hypothetical protein
MRAFLVLVIFAASAAVAADIDLLRLHRRVEQVAPIYGVSVGAVGAGGLNKARWRISFQPQATAQQRSAAQAVVTTFAFVDFFPTAAERRREQVRNLSILQGKLQSLQALAPTTPTAEYTAELVDLQSQIASAKTSAGLQ